MHSISGSFIRNICECEPIPSAASGTHAGIRFLLFKLTPGSRFPQGWTLSVISQSRMDEPQQAHNSPGEQASLTIKDFCCQVAKPQNTHCMSWEAKEQGRVGHLLLKATALRFWKQLSKARLPSRILQLQHQKPLLSPPIQITHKLANLPLKYECTFRGSP